MTIKVERNKNNPIIRGGIYNWRKVGTFNPAVIEHDNKIFMIERAIESIRPFICNFGLLESENGIDFKMSCDKPILTAKELGYPDGTIEDPRVVKIDGIFYMTFAYRKYTYNCYPTGIRVPDYTPLVGELDKGINHTLSGIASSKDLIHWTMISTINPNAEVDERDNVLFPEKINGKYALLRRPKNFKNEQCESPSIWISYSDDLINWDNPHLVAKPKYYWEGGKIGAGATPIKTDKGWLLLYHGVDELDIYRVGAMLLDLKDPEKVLKRTKEFFLEPTEYYEKFGLVIPNVIFPTGNYLKDDKLMIYYGCCDTCISLAEVELNKLFSVMQ